MKLDFNEMVNTLLVEECRAEALEILKNSSKEELEDFLSYYKNKEYNLCSLELDYLKKELIRDSQCNHLIKGYVSPKIYLYPETIYIPSFYFPICVKCGIFQISCKYIKERIKKYVPYYWRLVKKGWRQLEFIKRDCEYCMGEDATNLLEERNHAEIRGIETLFNKNHNSFKFLFGERGKAPEYEKLSKKIREMWGKKIGEARKLHDEHIEPHISVLQSCFLEAKNEFREKFGLPPVGGWISEASLFKLVKKLFKPTPVLFRVKPSWLKGLEVDIFIPEKKLAIEYMGQQHFEPVACFGGQKAFEGVKKRDKRKADICQKKGIKLLYFDYRLDITEENILKLLL